MTSQVKLFSVNGEDCFIISFERNGEIKNVKPKRLTKTFAIVLSL